MEQEHAAVPQLPPSGGIPQPPRPEHIPPRRWEILCAAFAVLMEKGWTGTSMLAIARRAGASKETLYNWFGSKEGLFAEMVRAQSQPFLGDLQAAIDDPAVPLEPTLARFGAGLLTLLTLPHVVALNRAAIASVTMGSGMNGQGGGSSALAALLLANGRERVKPYIGRLLVQRMAAGELRRCEIAEAAGTLIGLIMRATQIGVLLGGEAAPDAAQIEARGRVAAAQFMALYGTVPQS